MDMSAPPGLWNARVVPRPERQPSARFRLSEGMAVALLLHGLALYGITQYAAPVSLAAAGRPVSGAGVRVTLVSAPAPRPAPAPEKPARTAEPVAERHVATRPTPVLASERSQASRSVSVEPAPSPAPVELAAPTAQATPPAQAAQTAPAAINRELDLPGANAVKDVARIVCHFAQPPYPPLARRLRHEGTVSLRVTIDAGGKVSQAEVDDSSGFAELDAAAVQTLRAGRCDPYVENGQPANVRAVQALTFDLTH